MSVLRRILAGEAPVIAGDGSQSFDFIHVADVADANVRAMASDVSGVELNVGSGTEVSVAEIVRRLLELTGSDLEPTFDRSQKVHMRRRVGSSERARRAARLDRVARSRRRPARRRRLCTQMRVLVTGATGFVAPHLIRRLVADGHEVLALGHDRSRIPAGDGITPVVVDLAAQLDEAAVPDFDAVAHLAQANVPFPDGAGELYRVNVVSTQELLDLARRRGAARFVYASSGSVYGLGEGAVAEDDPRRADDFYGVDEAERRARRRRLPRPRRHRDPALLRPLRSRSDSAPDPGPDRAGPRRRCRDAAQRRPAADDADLRRRRRRGDRARRSTAMSISSSTSPETRRRRFASSPSSSARSSGGSRCSRTPGARRSET